jgi:hypothetical protein
MMPAIVVTPNALCVLCDPTRNESQHEVLKAALELAEEDNEANSYWVEHSCLMVCLVEDETPPVIVLHTGKELLHVKGIKELLPKCTPLHIA